MIYAGIGSRRTPESLLRRMENIACALAKNLWTLRSGGAPGADKAFERGCDWANGPKEIFLPWKGFENNPSPLFQVDPQALEIASRHHKKWKSLTPAVKKLMARNVHQILGEDLITPVSMVICWTSDGCVSELNRTAETGGTGLAISLAEANNVRIINLKNGDPFSL